MVKQMEIEWWASHERTFMLKRSNITPDEELRV